MKYLFILFLFPFLSEAKFSKPELVARLMNSDAWNAPDNMWCFTSSPRVLNGKIHLGCTDDKGYLMGEWSKEGFRILVRAESEQFFSHPISSFNKMSWYEYSDSSILRSYLSDEVVTPVEVTNLGPMSQSSESFLPYTEDSYFFQTKGQMPQLWVWKNNLVTPFFNLASAYIFSPQIGPQGEIAFKARDLSTNENAPDRLWFYQDGWKIILEDQDANPDSPWKSFRHLLSVEGNKVLTIATDGQGEALILIENGKTTILARAGADLAKFNFFTPKMRAGTIVFRGDDFEGRKVVYVHDQDGLRKLLTQGDIVQTDVTTARVDYHSREAIFYGAPGVDEKGSVVLQATLTDADYPATLLGIGIIKFNKE